MAALRVNFSFFLLKKRHFGNSLGKAKVKVTLPEGGHTFICHILLKHEIVFLTRVIYILWLIILGGHKWYIQCQRMWAICNLPRVIINTPETEFGHTRIGPVTIYVLIWKRMKILIKTCILLWMHLLSLNVLKSWMNDILICDEKSDKKVWEPQPKHCHD